VVSQGREPDEILALAERALAYAERAGATEAEALVIADDARLTRFANSEIHQNVAETNAEINLRFVVGRRVGVASSNRIDDEALRRLADRAGAIARNSEELDDWGGLPEPTPIQSLPEAFARGTAEATPELRADGVRAVISAADRAGVIAYGS
jgi:predicted Zn-dependent protease